jgi:hypothetical protein
VVASISLVELTGQISAAETAARVAAAASPVTAATVATSGAPVAPSTADVVPAGARSPLPPAAAVRQRIPGGQAAIQAAVAPVAVAIAVPGNGRAAARDGDAGPDDAPGEAQVPAGRSPTVALAASTDPPAMGTGVGVDDRPPANTADAVAWWRAHHPDMPVREICAKVGRSERTVRRILDRLPPQSVPVDEYAGDRAADAGWHRAGINGATVTPLADSVTSG